MEGVRFESCVVPRGADYLQNPASEIHKLSIGKVYNPEHSLRPQNCTGESASQGDGCNCSILPVPLPGAFRDLRREERITNQPVGEESYESQSQLWDVR